MSRREWIERPDALYKLLTDLPGADLGAVPECAETDPEVFFPEPGEIGARNAAVAICNRCPVREACLEKALQNGELGIWGGTTENQRRKIRRMRRLAAVPEQEAA